MNLVYVCAAIALAYLAGMYVGDQRADRACDVEAAEARGKVQGRFAAELERATEATLDITASGVALTTEIVWHKEKTRTIVKEVATDVASSDLAGCRVPARTHELRNEQVADSARIEADHRAMLSGGARGVRPADR